MSDSIAQSWHSCYNEPWTGIQPEAFSHPAKFSSALIRRIYQHALERGYLKPGDTVLDPFAGSGLGSRDALSNGLNWFGCELEQRFVDMGAGVECSGISKADWVRFYGRWEKMAHKDGRSWCPRCLAEARQVSPPLSSLGFNLSLFENEKEPTAAYTRNSGLIPETKPHYYQGNLDLFKKYAKPGKWAVLIQGDSRKLVEIVSLRMGAMRSSPPFGQGETRDRSSYQGGFVADMMSRAYTQDRQGSTPGNLATLKEGSLPAAISSPPYESYAVHKNGIDASKLQRPGHNSQAITMDDYGATEGQLGTMSKGDFEAAISSPPFAGNSGGRGEASRNGIDAALFERHSGGMVGGTGDDPGNLAHLPVRGFEAAIGSPPYSGSRIAQDAGNDNLANFGRSTSKGRYGVTDGQLGGLSEGSVNAAISSPPFVSSVGSDDPDKRGGLFRDPKRRNDCNLTGSYGETEGQLASLPTGEFKGVISSPPYINSVNAHDKGGIDWEKAGRSDRTEASPNRHGVQGDMVMAYGATNGQLGAMPAGEPVEQMAGMRSSPPFENGVAQFDKNFTAPHDSTGNLKTDYGSTFGQLGQETKETFWAAAKTIIEQVYCLLKPGGVTIWVTKRFVRDGEIVEFSQQWIQLCEAVGFEFVEQFQAMLVKENGTQATLDGGVIELRTERKSFFRRLHEKKAPHLAINYEDVLILRKPGGPIL